MPAKNVFDRLNVPGVRFSAKDLLYLSMEHNDALLTKDILLKCHGDAAAYFEKYILDKEGQFDSVTIKRNIRGRTISDYCLEFDANQKLRLHSRKDNVLAFHTIISIGKTDKDKVDEKMLRDISQYYMQLRGPSSLFVGAIHRNTESIHIHLVQSATQYMTGVSSRISKKEFNDITLAMQEMQRQRYPQLTNSLPDFSKDKAVKIGREETKKYNRFERTSVKDTVVQCLAAAYAKAKSPAQFQSLLKEQNIIPYERGSKTAGVICAGYKFRYKTLGYDTKLLELEARHARTEKALKDIRQAREGRWQVRDRVERKAAESKPEATLEVSSSLREIQAEREHANHVLSKEQSTDSIPELSAYDTQQEQDRGEEQAQFTQEENEQDIRQQDDLDNDYSLDEPEQ